MTTVSSISKCQFAHLCGLALFYLRFCLTNRLKSMLMIVMIFAQQERETIQQRVIDAYSSRSKRGFYMGG